MNFYHVTTPEAALEILSGGFRDARGFLTGVWISEKPLDFNEGCKGDTILRLNTELETEQFARYELVEEEKPYREWCVPARLLNHHFSVRVVDWGHISLQRSNLKRCAVMRLAVKARTKREKHLLRTLCAEQKPLQQGSE